MMKERPILFNAPMVQAILEGLKTQTRRIIKWPGKNKPADIRRNPDNDPWYKDFIWSMRTYNGAWGDYKHNRFLKFCQQGKPGDRLWVKETYSVNSLFDDQKPSEIDKRAVGGIAYLADGKRRHGKIRQSIFMPRWASRIDLGITNIKVERIQDISEEDALAEGVKSQYTEDEEDSYCHVDNNFLSDFPSETFSMFWDSVNKKRGYGWDVNPWVWVITFKLLEVKR